MDPDRDWRGVDLGCNCGWGCWETRGIEWGSELRPWCDIKTGRYRCGSVDLCDGNAKRGWNEGELESRVDSGEVVIGD